MQRAVGSPLAAWALYLAIGTLSTLALVFAACQGDAKAKQPPAPPAAKKPTLPPDAGVVNMPPLDASDGGFTPKNGTYDDLGSAFAAILRDKPRVLGIGELHMRTDKTGPSVSTLSRFSHEVLPVLASQTSDMVLETWMVDPGCKTGAAATARVESAMKRPASTKDEIGALFGIAKANSITAHVMRLTCDDLNAVAPEDKRGEVDAEKMLDLVTRELDRIARSAVRYRDEHSEARPLIIVYGGALHNDLYPYKTTARWSYAKDVDDATGGRFVEVDLYPPELIEGNQLYEHEDWYPLFQKSTAAAADKVLLIERAPHSWLAILPRS